MGYNYQPGDLCGQASLDLPWAVNTDQTFFTQNTHMHMFHLKDFLYLSYKIYIKPIVQYFQSYCLTATLFPNTVVQLFSLKILT